MNWRGQLALYTPAHTTSSKMMQGFFIVSSLPDYAKRHARDNGQQVAEIALDWRGSANSRAFVFAMATCSHSNQCDQASCVCTMAYAALQKLVEPLPCYR